MQRAYYRRLDLKLTATVLFIAAPLALGGCGLVQQAKMGKAKERLVGLRADCRARYLDSHAQMADCPTAAENDTVRPSHTTMLTCSR